MNNGVTIILDTDMDTDCDDAGALAMLHNLMSNREADIAGVICSSPTRWGAPFIRWMNQYYGRSNIPVGRLRQELMENDDRFGDYRAHAAKVGDARLYNRSLVNLCSGRLLDGGPVHESTQLYRKLLAGQEDNSIVICAVGTLTALAELLHSEADVISELDGYSLVRRKVRLLVTMGGGILPTGMDRFNWRMDPLSAEKVLNSWPSTVAISASGEDVMTGASLAEKLDEQHPLRQAYEIYLGGAGLSRPSWDQVALLYAVRGADGFRETRGYTFRYDAKSLCHEWVQVPIMERTGSRASKTNELRTDLPAERVFVEREAAPYALAREIEALMTES